MIRILLSLFIASGIAFSQFAYTEDSITAKAKKAAPKVPKKPTAKSEDKAPKKPTAEPVDPNAEFVILKKRPSKVLPMRDSQIVQSPLKSIDDAFWYMEVTNPYTSSFGNRVRTGVDTNKAETQRLADLVSGKIFPGTAMKDLGIHQTIYGISIEEMADLYVKAMKSGMREIHLTVDLNRCTTMDAKKRKVKIADLKPSDFEPKNPMSIFILKLLDNGMKFATAQSSPDSGYWLYSSPLDGGDMIDIMHLKDSQYVAYKSGSKEIDKLVSFHHTYNLTEANRENRGWADADPVASAYRLQKSKDFEATFKQEKEIWEIPSRKPLRIVYKDGTYQDIGYTDGKYNPNSRMENTLKRAAKGETKFIRLIGSHFAPTASEIVSSFAGVYGKDASGKWGKLEPGILDVNPEPNILFLSETKFSSTNGYGKPAYFSGYDIKPPRGAQIWGMPEKNRKNVKTYIFQGPNDSGHAEEDADGPPTGHILHDKFTYIETEDVLNPMNEANPTGPKEVIVEINNDSLNDSHHFANLEVQDRMVMRSNSWIAKACVESIDKMIEAYTKPDKMWLVPGKAGIFRDSLARLIGHAAREIPLDTLKTVGDLLATGKNSEAEQVLIKLAESPTEYSKKPDVAAIKTRLNQLTKFADWNLKEGLKNPLSAAQLASVAMALTFEGTDLAWNLKAALKRIYWGAQGEAQIKGAWAALEVKENIPVAQGQAKTPATEKPEIETFAGKMASDGISLPQHEHPNQELADHAEKNHVDEVRDANVAFQKMHSDCGNALNPMTPESAENHAFKKAI